MSFKCWEAIEKKCIFEEKPHIRPLLSKYWSDGFILYIIPSLWQKIFHTFFFLSSLTLYLILRLLRKNKCAVNKERWQCVYFYCLNSVISYITWICFIGCNDFHFLNWAHNYFVICMFWIPSENTRLKKEKNNNTIWAWKLVYHLELLSCICLVFILKDIGMIFTPGGGWA